MARLLFLGASVSQVPGIRFAKNHGHEVVACDGDPNAVAFPLCDVAAVVDFSDVDRVVEVGRRERIDGVLAVCTDRAVVPAALVARRLGLAGLDPDVARTMTHKSKMREKLAASRVPQPRFASISREVSPEWDGFPAVLKPADSGGQRGIYRVETMAQVHALLPLALEASRCGEAILEEYVEGDEVNTLFAVRGGEPVLLSISDRLRPGGAGFGVGWIHQFPAALAPAMYARVAEVAAAAIRCLGMQDGIAFPQLLVGKDGPQVVEVAARIAAGQMADLVYHGTGVELYGIAIQQSLGRDIPDEAVTPSKSRPIAIRFLTAAPGVLPVGTVRAIEGLDAVRNAPGVLDAGVYFEPGTAIGPLRVDADRRGYVIATGASADEALANADDASHLLRVTVDSGEPARDFFERSRRRAAGFLAAVAVCLLLVGTIGAFVLTERAKLQHALVLGTRVDKTFSPTCRCIHDIAHIAFRLVRPAEAGVRILNSSGAAVDTLLRARPFRSSVLRLVWDGRTSRHVVARDGTYFPEVVFPALHRSLRLPSPMVVDTLRPSILTATLHRNDDRLMVRYRFSEAARAALLIDGRRAVLTRFAPEAGIVRWDGRFASGARLPRRRAWVGLVAIDPAGNRSFVRHIGSV